MPFEQDGPDPGSVDEALVGLLQGCLQTAAHLGMELVQGPDGVMISRTRQPAEVPAELMQQTVEAAQVLARRLGVQGFDRFDSIEQLIERAKSLQLTGQEIMLTAVVNQQTGEETCFAVGPGAAAGVLRDTVMDESRNTLDPRFDQVDDE